MCVHAYFIFTFSLELRFSLRGPCFMSLVGLQTTEAITGACSKRSAWDRVEI